jgi:FkbM family methyltransferase
VVEKLEENIRLNQFNITAVEKGVSNFNGTAIIYDIPFEHVYSVTINKNFNAPDQKVIPTEIQVIALSSYAEIHQLKKIDLVKIDVETHEPEVLEGMIEILRKDKPALIIEILNDEVADKVNRLLSPLHYLFFILDDAKGPQRTSSIKKNAFKNFLVCSQMDADYLMKASVIAV